MKRLLCTLVALVLVVMAGSAIGCVSQDEPTPPVEPTEPTTPAEPTAPVEPEPESATVRLYFTRGDRIGVAGRGVEYTEGDDALAAAAVEALLAGPTAEEAEFGLDTVIPEGTTLNGVVISNGTATVDLSTEFESGGGTLSMTLRVAQVVYTLTQFEGIATVSFKLDGTPLQVLGGEGIILRPAVSRADFEDVTPPILVESPVPGQIVTSPFTVSGTANVFEAQFMLNVTDPEGLIITEQSVMATSGTGTRGTFSAPVEFDSTRTGLGAFIFFDISMKDGSPLHIIEIPVRMTE